MWRRRSCRAAGPPDTCVSPTEASLIQIQRPMRKAAATLLLAGFLTQAGDGLLTLLCHEASEEPVPSVALVHGSGDDRATGAGHAGGDHSEASSERVTEPIGGPLDDSGEPLPHEGTCPLGPAAMIGCSGAVTAMIAAPAVRSMPVIASRLSPSEPAEATGSVLASGTFRPPRA